MGHNASFARDQANQEPERLPDLFKILEDIGMVELHRSQNHRLRKVVQKLRPFVEKRGVVLVALNDEVFPLAEGKAASEILGDAADQERRIFARGLEYPGQH